MLGDDMLTQSDDGSEDENGEDSDSDDLPAKERREELLKIMMQTKHLQLKQCGQELQ